METPMSDLDQAANSLRDHLTRLGANDFEIYVQARRGVALEVLKGRRSAFEVKNTAGFAVRAAKNGHMGFAYGSDFSNGGLATVCQRALEATAFTDAEPGFHFAPGAAKLAATQLTETDLALIPLEAKLDLALRMEAACYAADPRVRTVRNAGYDDEIEDTLLWTSEGLQAKQRRTLCTLGVSVVAEANGESEVGSESAFAPNLNGLNPEAVGLAATQAAVEILGGQPMANATLPIILVPSVAGEFLSLLAASFLGDAVAKGQSILAGKLGVAAYAPGLTIIDDGLYPNGIATAAFDGEGTPQQKTMLVQEGRTAAFLYDRFWAHRAGTQSTGNARRPTIAQPPKLGWSNLYIPAGKTSASGLQKHLQDGVVVTQSIGMHLSNAVSGRFSIGIQGYRVQNGARVGAIRSAALAGNVHDLFKQVREQGSDLKFYGKIGAPSLLIDGAEISGTVA
jgi:PmbA protein